MKTPLLGSTMRRARILTNTGPPLNQIAASRLSPCGNATAAPAQKTGDTVTVEPG